MSTMVNHQDWKQPDKDQMKCNQDVLLMSINITVWPVLKTHFMWQLQQKNFSTTRSGLILFQHFFFYIFGCSDCLHSKCVNSLFTKCSNVKKAEMCHLCTKVNGTVTVEFQRSHPNQVLRNVNTDLNIFTMCKNILNIDIHIFFKLKSVF